MYLANVCLTHETCTHETLARVMVPESGRTAFCRSFLENDDIDEVIILQTCNRFELYFSGRDEAHGIEQARAFLTQRFCAEVSPLFTINTYMDAVHHLFSITASLDSMVVGEQQVQAQVKAALETALAEKFAGTVLDVVFRKALSVGKRIRTETKIAEGKLSIASTAIDMAHSRTSLDGKNVLIVGTGTMASLVADYLSDFDCAAVHVAGRTPEHIDQFCTRHGVSACALDDGLKCADVVFSATSSPHVLITHDLAAAVGRPIMIIDIAMPSDVDETVSMLPNVFYASIDDLRAVTQETLASRKDEIEKARCIIDDECDRFRERVHQAHIERFIAPMTQFIENIRRQEVDRATTMLATGDPADVLTTFSKALTKKLMHNFVTGVKSSPLTAEELKRFTDIFIGNGHVSEHENEETQN